MSHWSIRDGLHGTRTCRLSDGVVSYLLLLPPPPPPPPPPPVLHLRVRGWSCHLGRFSFSISCFFFLFFRVFFFWIFFFFLVVWFPRPTRWRGRGRGRQRPANCQVKQPTQSTWNNTAWNNLHWPLHLTHTHRNLRPSSLFLSNDSSSCSFCFFFVFFLPSTVVLVIGFSINFYWVFTGFHWVLLCCTGFF